MRFFLGIGVGAEYPCGSVAASEQSEEPSINKHARHRWLGLATITTLVFGFSIASFTTWVLYLIFGPNHLRAVWRLALGLGAVPAIGVLLWRLNMDEPVRYKSDSMKHAPIPYKLVIRRYWASLAAISIVWFILDIIVYPVSLIPDSHDMVPSSKAQFQIYASTVLNKYGTRPEDNFWMDRGHQVKFSLSHFNSLPIQLCSLFYLPGALIGSLIVDFVGPKWTLVIGYVLQALVGFIISGLYVPLSKHIATFSALYGLFQAFAEFGAGLCTFILAAKACPTAVRGQYFGVAAACGKL
ncbi:hypothetical protein H0H93_005647, partial [Arthromyces matolae]